MSDDGPPVITAYDATVIPAHTRDQVVAILNERAPNSAKCPVCISGNFTLGMHYVSAPVVTPEGGMIIGGTSYPSVMLLCTFCGHTRLHNAVILGVVAGHSE